MNKRDRQFVFNERELMSRALKTVGRKREIFDAEIILRPPVVSSRQGSDVCRVSVQNIILEVSVC